MREIPLTRGLVALVDDADYEMLSRFRWFSQPKEYTAYALRNETANGRQTTKRMHRMIMLPGPEQHVDHINGDGLDNRRSNLRLCTHGQNMRNGRPRSGARSQFKGVDWDKQHRKWRARVTRDSGQRLHVGFFDTESEAANAYDVAATEAYGEFARINVAG